ASLLIQDVGEGDTTGGGGGLGCAENMDNLGGDPVGSGLPDAGTGGDQLVQRQAQQRLLVRGGGGDQCLPGGQHAVGDQLQQLAACGVAAVPPGDEPLHVGGVLGGVTHRGPRRRGGGRSIRSTGRRSAPGSLGWWRCGQRSGTGCSGR